MTAKLARPEGNVYASLHVQGQNPELTWAFLTVVEAKPMETGLVTVDAAARLRADGVGPLAPLASNEPEEGRARNRRVELVKQ